MTSSLGAGDAAKQAENIRESECPNSLSDDKSHDWEKKGSWPSTWHECTQCSATYYNK